MIMMQHVRQAEREQRIAAERAEMGDSERQVEEQQLLALLAPLGLTLRDIPVRILLLPITGHEKQGGAAE